MAEGSSASAACAPVIAAEMQSQRATAPVTREMFHADNVNPYPENLSTAVVSNLLSHPGNARNAIPTGIQVTGTELTYHAFLLGDWAAALGGSLVPNSGQGVSFQPHNFGSNPTVVSSCQEWVYELYGSQATSPYNVSLTQDALAGCGADLGCRMTQMFSVQGSPFADYSQPNGLAPTSVFVAATPARTKTQVGIDYQNNTAVSKNPFLQVAIQFLEQQDIATYLTLTQTNWDCNAGMYGPFSPSPDNPSPSAIDFTPTLYTGQNMAAKLATLRGLLGSPQVYIVGNGTQPPYSTVAGQFADERSMITTLWAQRILPDGTQSDFSSVNPFDLAIADRIAHLKQLVATYESLAHYTCADIPAVSSSSSSGGSGGGYTGGGGGSGSGSGGKPKPVDQVVVNSQQPAPPPLPPVYSPGVDLPTDTLSRLAAADAIQDEIVTFLLEELDRPDGCLDLSQTACDIDAAEITTRLISSFDDPQEADYQSCVAWTGGTFPPTPVSGVNGLITAKIQAAQKALGSAPGIATSSEPQGTGPMIDAPGSPIDTQAARIAAAATSRNAVGQVITGSHYMGDPDLAGGGYAYGGYWKVTPSNFSGTAGAACEYDGAVHGELHGRIDLLEKVAEPICAPVDAQLDALANTGVSYQDAGSEIDTSLLDGVAGLAEAAGFPDPVTFCIERYRLRHLADAYMTATAVPSQAGYDASIFFGGQQIWSAEGAAVTPNISASWPAVPIELQGPEETIVVVVIPVTFDLYGEIQYGASGSAQVGSFADCTNPSLKAQVTFTPWATVDAIGSVGVGFSFAQAGVRGKIRVLDASLPLSAMVAIAPDDMGLPSLQASAHANLQLTLMSGSLSAFAEVNVGPIDEEAEWQFASWSGYKKTISFLNWDLAPIELPVFNEANWSTFQNSQQGP
jgi:hypothetical protein